MIKPFICFHTSYEYLFNPSAAHYPNIDHPSPLSYTSGVPSYYLYLTLLAQRRARKPQWMLT